MKFFWLAFASATVALLSGCMSNNDLSHDRSEPEAKSVVAEAPLPMMIGTQAPPDPQPPVTGAPPPLTAATQIPALNVQTGQTHRLPAQRWEFASINIEQGATLIVETGGGYVLHLIVHGPMTLRGRIIARDFNTEERQLTLGVQGSPPITVAYSNRNRGGNGGNGQNQHTGRGGRGARGTTEFGGGGGSGAEYMTGKPTQWVRDGADAGDDRGAPPVGICGGNGGSGAVRAQHGNGGAIILEVAGPFDGFGGTIDLSGSRGASGQPGTGRTLNSTHCGIGSGGGGGGGPGGQGGFLVARLAGGSNGYPEVNVTGGKGGPGGGPTGSPGSAGEPGASGAVHWIVP